jgi:Cof subfamily protein (haloacid dehalogenase superfamily)
MYVPAHYSQPKYRLVATDLDGTLLRSDGGISPFTRHTIHQAVDDGVALVLVTARPLEAATYIAADLGATATICLSGAVTYGEGGRRILDKAPLAPEMVRRLRDRVRLRCRHVTWGYETMTGRHLEPEWDRDRCGLSRERETYPLDRGRVPAGDLLSVLAACPAHAGTCMERWLAEESDGWGAVFSPAAGIIEITAKAATKAAALARLCELRGIPPEQVVAFGDTLNDLTMLTWAGMGVAVENATDQLRDIVRVTALRNDCDGVAHTLRYLLDAELFASSPITSASSRLHQIGAVNPA